MSSCSSNGSSVPACCSSLVSDLFDVLDSAAESMMVHRDFHTTFDTCSKGLEDLASGDAEDDRFVKQSLHSGTSFISAEFNVTFLCFLPAGVQN